jgi:hypothetical protein
MRHEDFSTLNPYERFNRAWFEVGGYLLVPYTPEYMVLAQRVRRLTGQNKHVSVRKFSVETVLKQISEETQAVKNALYTGALACLSGRCGSQEQMALNILAHLDKVEDMGKPMRRDKLERRIRRYLEVSVLELASGKKIADTVSFVNLGNNIEGIPIHDLARTYRDARFATKSKLPLPPIGEIFNQLGIG